MPTDTYTSPPHLESIPQAAFAIGGEVGQRLAAITEQWLLPAVKSNPAMLEMFRRRDRQPYQLQWAWVGEYAGKYLTHAVQIYRLRRDKGLYEQISWFVDELLTLQDEDGYLGPWPKAWRLRKSPPNRRGFPDITQREPWDAWGHYHMMLGLLLWHSCGEDERALQGAQRIGDLLCNRFLGTDERLYDTGELEMNLSPIHSLCLLYRETGEERYLALAREIEHDFERPPAGDYIRLALAGVPFFEMPKPRWESLHAIQGIAELFFITGEDNYRQAYQQIWWSIAEGDRHNNGGFSSGERAMGDPYHQAAIETCCTVAWMALSVDMLRLTGNSVAADELEIAMFNSGLGLISPSGRWVTYNTPMDGERHGTYQDINFHSQAGGPELSCCTVNGPRALGLTAEWAIMRSNSGLTLNYYGPGMLTATLASGNRVTLIQETDYPVTAKVELRVQLDQAETFTLALRIPHWSEHTSVWLNDKQITGVSAGQYLRLEHTWTGDEQVIIEFDFRPHFWVNPHRRLNEVTSSTNSEQVYYATSIYRGPILLAFDPRFNDLNSAKVPGLQATNLQMQLVADDSWLKPWVLVAIETASGDQLRLCDFASAGAAGDEYRSWLPVSGVPAKEFSRKNPLRTVRVTGQ